MRSAQLVGSDIFVVFFVDLFEVGVGDMGINLRCGNITMAEHSLNTSNISAIHE